MTTSTSTASPTATTTSTLLRDPRLPSALAVVATAIWLGGLLALGAIVAPVVFTMIPRPEAADAMTVVFARFDVVAVGCVAVVLASEAWRATGKRPIATLDVARMVTAAVGSTLVLLEALWITPAIVALHRGGALRGLGPAGLELDRMHGLAEACGKAQAVLALALLALHVATLAPHPLRETSPPWPRA
jgi:putative copper export protein